LTIIGACTKQDTFSNEFADVTRRDIEELRERRRVDSGASHVPLYVAFVAGSRRAKKDGNPGIILQVKTDELLNLFKSSVFLGSKRYGTGSAAGT
jgi:hypothetical protein